MSPVGDFKTMEMRPCVPTTSSYSARGFDCFHFIDPESLLASNTWDMLNVALLEPTQRAAESLGLPADADFDEITRRIDSVAQRTKSHVVDVFYDILEGSPSAATAKAIQELFQDLPEVPEADINVINRHRRSLGMSPIDLSKGWGEEELRDMAESIRTTGRMRNPQLKRKLMR